jgi:hypothetical protein
VISVIGTVDRFTLGGKPTYDGDQNQKRWGRSGDWWDFYRDDDPGRSLDSR